MEYTREVLDRKTGELHTSSLGNYITVTELGRLHGVGPRRVRAILHHMGLLRREGKRYRLAPFAVERGLGMRHDKSRSGIAFDVLSPKCQQLISEVWDLSVRDLNLDDFRSPEAYQAAASLAGFRLTRPGLTAQQEVCWLIDHFPKLKQSVIGDLVGVTLRLVERHIATRERQLLTARRAVKANVPVHSADMIRQNVFEGQLRRLRV